MLIRTRSWDSLATQEGPEITKKKCGTPVMEDLLVSAERSSASGQSQEFLLSAGLP